jgi:hypothetical protein
MMKQRLRKDLTSEKPTSRPSVAQRPSNPLPVREAETAAGVIPDRFERTNVPDDAAMVAIGSAESERSIRIGNREFKVKLAELAGRKINTLPDLPDVRDRIYQPTLRPVKAQVLPSIGFPVRDQRSSSACTGFALAHVIDVLTQGDTAPPKSVSARMLYEMAKRNDEWAGSAYEGSSVRGTLSGFFRNGVCSSDLVPDDGGGEWKLTYEMNKEAQERRLGAYYRLQPDISDYHAVLNELGAIYASAQIHSNWEKPVKGVIVPDGKPIGGHAFAIVGYNSTGFYVLNSWGRRWGRNGVAHWSYADWASSIMDAWVLQLGVRAPAAFGLTPRSAPSGTVLPQAVPAPNRSDIVGHFINIDDGRYVTSGRYASPTEAEMMETVKRLTTDGAGGNGYEHLVIYCHGGLNSLDDEATRIGAWQRRSVFKRNGIYNFHLMWGSGFLDEAFGTFSDSQAGRVAGIVGDILFETGAGKALGSRAWRNMKQDASAAFSGDPDYDGGYRGLGILLGALDHAKRRPKLHLVGHSAGSIVLGQFLAALDRFNLKKLELTSIHLMAPACTVAFFNERYGRYLDGVGPLKLRDKLYLYALGHQLEFNDTVGFASFPAPYKRSLLYLVSRAYEDAPRTPIAGMQIYASGLKESSRLRVDYSRSDVTASTSHGGFDNDAATLTSIMSRILQAPAPKPPTKDELLGY